MARAIIHNSDYPSVERAKAAIDRHFAERIVISAIVSRKLEERFGDVNLSPLLFCWPTTARILSTNNNLRILRDWQTTECRSWVNRVILVVSRLFPVFLRKRTSSRLVGMSEKCQRRKSPLSFDRRASDELISYYHERKTGEQVRLLRGSQPTIHHRPSFRATLQGERASQWLLEAHHDDPAPCKTQPECRLFP
jgi:hypothetical protein